MNKKSLDLNDLKTPFLEYEPSLFGFEDEEEAGRSRSHRFAVASPIAPPLPTSLYRHDCVQSPYIALAPVRRLEHRLLFK